MANSPYKTLGNIRTAIINDAKEASSTGLITQVNRWVNEGYEQVILRKKREWLDTQFTQRVNSSTQSVCSVTFNSQVITFPAATTFPPNSVERIFYTTGFNEIYNVSSTSGTTLSILSPYLGSTNTSTAGVAAQNSILLDPSIRHIYQVYHQWSSEPLVEVGPQQFREITERYGPNLDYPRYCTIFGQDDTSSSRRMLFYPYPNTAFTIYIDANVYVTPLSADTDEPVMPMQHRQILYHFGMYKLWSYHRNDAKASEALGNFNTMLTKIDGEARVELDFPQIKVAYPRGRRTGFFPSFDTRLREDP